MPGQRRELRGEFWGYDHGLVTGHDKRERSAVDDVVVSAGPVVDTILADR